MKEVILNILDKYLKIFPNEAKRQEALLEYLKRNNDKSVVDWNNFDGHIVAGGFIYAKHDKKFLVLWHKDLNMYLYPGGHVDLNDKSILDAAIREVKEETSLNDFSLVSLQNDKYVPIDIDTQNIRPNLRLDLPSHYHFDFRYLFVVDKICDIKIDLEEHSEYKWINIDEFKQNENFGEIYTKFKYYI